MTWDRRTQSGWWTGRRGGRGRETQLVVRARPCVSGPPLLHTLPAFPCPLLCAQEADPRAPHQPAPWPAGFVADPAMRGADGRTKGARRAGTAALPLSLPPRSFTPQSLQACGSSASAQPPFPCPFRAWKDGDSFPPLLVSGCLQPSLVPLTPFIPRQAVPSLKSFPCTFWVNLVSCWNSDSDTKVMHVG